MESNLQVLEENCSKFNRKQNFRVNKLAYLIEHDYPKINYASLMEKNFLSSEEQLLQHRQ